MDEASPTFVGSARLGITDLVDFRAFRGLLIFLLLGPFLGAYALSERASYEGVYSHRFMGVLAVLCALILLVSLIVLGRRIAWVLRGKPFVEIRVFTDRIAFLERSKVRERSVEEEFACYKGHVEDPRGLFLISMRPPTQPRQSFVPRACFPEHWSEVREFIVARVPTDLRTEGGPPKQKRRKVWILYALCVGAFLLIYILRLVGK